MRSAPFQVSSDTSVESAQSVTRGTKRVTDAGNIMALGQQRGSHGFTSSEAGIELRLGPQTVTPRVWELVHANCLVRTARTRLTPSGKSAHVYEVAPGATLEQYVAWIKQRRSPKRPDLSGLTPRERGVRLIKQAFPDGSRPPEVQLCLDELEGRTSSFEDAVGDDFLSFPDD